MAMTAVVTDTIPKTQDDNYHNIFFTEWNVNYGDVLDIGVEEDCDAGKDDIKVAEMIVGMATAPEVGENQDWDFYAPEAGKSSTVSTKLFAFKFAASQDFRRYGHSQRLNEYPVKQAQILLNTVKIRFYNLLNNAFSSSYPLAYDAKELIATDHPLAGGGTGTNELATPADLSEDTLEALVQLLAETVNEDGNLSPISPRKLVTSMSQWGDSVRYLESALTVDQLTAASGGDVQASGNAINAINRKYNITPHNNPLILDPDAVFLIGERSPLTVLFADQGRPDLMPSYVDKGNQAWVWPCQMKMTTYAKTWRGIVGTAGA